MHKRSANGNRLILGQQVYINTPVLCNEECDGNDIIPSNLQIVQIPKRTKRKKETDKLSDFSVFY